MKWYGMCDCSIWPCGFVCFSCATKGGTEETWALQRAISQGTTASQCDGNVICRDTKHAAPRLWPGHSPSQDIDDAIMPLTTLLNFPIGLSTAKHHLESDNIRTRAEVMMAALYCFGILCSQDSTNQLSSTPVRNLFRQIWKRMIWAVHNFHWTLDRPLA